MGFVLACAKKTKTPRCKITIKSALPLTSQNSIYDYLGRTLRMQIWYACACLANAGPMAVRTVCGGGYQQLPYVSVEQ